MSTNMLGYHVDAYMGFWYALLMIMYLLILI